MSEKVLGFTAPSYSARYFPTAANEQETSHIRGKRFNVNVTSPRGYLHLTKIDTYVRTSLSWGGNHSNTRPLILSLHVPGSFVKLVNSFLVPLQLHRSTAMKQKTGLKGVEVTLVGFDYN